MGCPQRLCLTQSGTRTIGDMRTPKFFERRRAILETVRFRVLFFFEICTKQKQKCQNTKRMMDEFKFPYFNQYRRWHVAVLLLFP